MRKDYEERLDTLAESKREALRELNKMFEAKLEEKDTLLQEVFHTYNSDMQTHNTHIHPHTYTPHI